MSTSQKTDDTRLDGDEDRDVALANAVLDYFEVVTKRSEEMLASDRPSGASALANVQTLTAETALTKLKSISADKRKALRDQIAEPAIARLITIDENGKEEELFIFRGTPYAEGTGRQVASYKSAKGRLASLDVGDEVEIVTKRHGVVEERSYESIEKAELHPQRTKTEWDSSDSVIYRIDKVPITIVSLRALLKEAGVPEEALGELDAVLQQGRDSDNVFMGLRRAVVRKMALRDRPLLDKLQDEIFRLPLQSRIALLGPPGSGKTTTLIKRLGLKLDIEYLDEDEKRAVGRSQAGETGHADSWFMFTPTELLKLYVKEAFNREGVPAPEARMKTWETHRREIARSSLGILRIRNTGSIMRSDLPSLADAALDDPIGWFEDFDQWQRNAFWTDLGTAAETLSESDDPQLKAIVRRIQAAVDGTTTTTSASPIVSLERLAPDVEPALKALSEEITAPSRRASRATSAGVPLRPLMILPCTSTASGMAAILIATMAILM